MGSSPTRGTIDLYDMRVRETYYDTDMHGNTVVEEVGKSEYFIDEWADFDD